MTGTMLLNNSNADDKIDPILIRLEDAVRDTIQIYVTRNDGAFNVKCIEFLTKTLPWTISSEKWDQVLQAFEEFTLSLEPGKNSLEGKIRAQFAGSYHLQGAILKQLGNAGIDQFETRIKANIEDAIQFSRISGEEIIAGKLETYLYKRLPYLHVQSKSAQILETVQQFGMSISSLDSETAEAALSKSLKATCEFYSHYIPVAEKLNAYVGGWHSQVNQFKEETFKLLLDKRDLVQLKSEVLKFSSTLVSTLGITEALGYGSTLKADLETLANQIPDESLSSESMAALVEGIRDWPFQVSGEMLAQTITLTDDQITPGEPTEVDLSSTPTGTRILTDSSNDSSDEILSSSTSSIQSSSSNSNYQPRSLLDRLLNRNLPPLAIEYARPGDTKESHKRYADLLDKALELESELADLKQKQIALQEQIQALKAHLKATETTLLQSQNSEQMERGWKELQVIQVSKERDKNAKLTKQFQTVLEEVTALKKTCKDQSHRIGQQDFAIARYEQVQAELESKHVREIAALRKQIVTLTRQAADLNGALLLVGQSSSSENISSEITPGSDISPSLTLQFDALKDQNGSMNQEEIEIVERLTQLSMSSPRPERQNNSNADNASPHP